MMRMIVVNQYGDEVMELEKNGMYWKVKQEDMDVLETLDEGDVMKVISVWTED